MESGVTILEPARTVDRAAGRVGADTVIHPGRLAPRPHRGAARAASSTRAPGSATAGSARASRIEPYSVLDGAEVGDGCRVGPFARLRPASRLLRRSPGGQLRRGEELRARGRGRRSGHLAYVGDATVGEGANLGAGVVTCNYDGVRKNPTEIGRGAFIGSDTMLVAPGAGGRRRDDGGGLRGHQERPRRRAGGGPGAPEEPGRLRRRPDAAAAPTKTRRTREEP